MRRVLSFFRDLFRVVVLAWRHRKEIQDLVTICTSFDDPNFVGQLGPSESSAIMGICDQCLVEGRSAPNCLVETVIVGSGPDAWTFTVAICPSHGRDRPWIEEKRKLWERLYGGR